MLHSRSFPTRMLCSRTATGAETSFRVAGELPKGRCSKRAELQVEETRVPTFASLALRSLSRFFGKRRREMIDEPQSTRLRAQLRLGGSFFGVVVARPSPVWRNSGEEFWRLGLNLLAQREPHSVYASRCAWRDRLRLGRRFSAGRSP